MQPQKKRKAQEAPKQKPPKRQRVAKSYPNGALGAAPVAYAAVRPDVRMLSMAPTRRGSEVRFIGCDYLGSVTTSATTGTDNVYEMDPGVSASFPRLSSIATVFGKYAFNRLRVYVVGKAASTLPGDMTSVPVYDGASGGGSLTESQVKNRNGQVTSKFWENHVMDFDCSRATVPWFTITQLSSTASDTTTFGWYHLFLETTGSAAGAVAVADVFIEYDIEFTEAKAAGDVD
jgi:hypothetical protein